mgnify:FL=1
MNIRSLSIRIDDELGYKLRVAASYEGRSANAQILILIRDFVQKYENEHGPIENPNTQSHL